MTEYKPNPDLLAAVENLYSVFRRYCSAKPVKGCPCCVAEEETKGIVTKPLLSLSAEDLERFALKAMTTWGSVDDFKHFLPRILELIITAEFYAGEFAIGKLRYGRWSHWPAKEQVAVREFLASWWCDTLNRPLNSSASAYSCLSCIMQAESDIAAYLNLWDSDVSLLATLQLADFLDCNHAELIKKQRLGDIFSRDLIVMDWLFRDEILRRFEKAFFKASNDASQATLSLAVMQWEQAKFVVKASGR